jgi:BirA family transcriptional regulator, biotin operon repressor / biotin---[acetyl-CoA-carboxylase] ligase
LSLPDDLGAALRRAAPRLGPFAQRIQWHPGVTSTNDLAARLAENGAEEGMVVMADAQSAGRGRHGRSWASPTGAGLYVSTVLRPSEAAAPLVTLAAGVALAEGIEEATGLTPHLKWPNDLYVGARKLAGILAEGGASPKGLPHVVLGFGINVLPASYPPEIASRVTSLEGELGRPVDRGALLASSLVRLAARYTDLQEGRRSAVLDAWRRHAAPALRRAVEWESDGASMHGVAEDIDGSGALLVRVGDDVVRVMSGEVRWI